MSSERNMAQRSKTNNMPAGHLKGKVDERFLSAGMWHIAQSSSSGYSSTSRMDDTLAVGTVFRRGAYSKGAHASVLHSKIPRRTRRFQNLQAVLDQAERNSSCAAIGPDDENYRLARQSVRDGALLNPFPLLYVRSQFWHNLKPGEQALCILRGAYEAHPSWTFCLYSAALAHGLSVSYRLVSQVYVRSSRRSPTRGNEYVRRCYTRARADEVTMARGLPVTSLMQTLLDCLIAGPLPDALAITDSALRLYGISKEDLTAFMLVQGKRRPGLRRALEVAALADARAESGGESICAASLLQKGSCYQPTCKLSCLIRRACAAYFAPTCFGNYRTVAALSASSTVRRSTLMSACAPAGRRSTSSWRNGSGSRALRRWACR